MQVPSLEEIEARVRKRLKETGAVSMVDRASDRRRHARFLALERVAIPTDHDAPAMSLVALRARAQDTR